MQKAESQKNCNTGYSLDGVMEYLNDQVRNLTDKQEEWEQERASLQSKVKNLQAELKKQIAINVELSKKLKHKRSSSQDKTVIFNQTNISSYYPIIMMPKATGWVCKQNLKSHLDSVRGLAWHKQHLITAGQDALIKVWKDGDLKNTIREHLGPIYALTASGNTVFTGGLEGVIRQWNFDSLLANGHCEGQNQIHGDVIWDLQHHPTEKLLLSSGADGIIKLVKTQGKNLPLKAEFKRKYQNGLNGVDIPTSVQWLGSTFVSGYQSLSSLLIFDVETQKSMGQLRYTTTEACSQPNKVLFSDFKQFLISGHQDKYVRFFDPKSAKLIKQMIAHTDAVYSISLQSHSPFFCSGSADGSVRYWDIRNYKCLSDLPIHRKKYDEGANVVLYHPHELMIAVGGADGLVKILHSAE